MVRSCSTVFFDILEGGLVAVVSSFGTGSLHYVWAGTKREERVSLSPRCPIMDTAIKCFTPPLNDMFVGLERGRMYTIYQQVPKDQHQIKFGPHQKFFTLEHELERVNLPREETTTWSSQIAITRSALDNVAQPY